MDETRFDACNTPPPPFGEGAQAGKERMTRSFIGVHFRCCSAYGRVYLKDTELTATGHCPRCGRRIEFLIAEDGSSARFFTAY